MPHPFREHADVLEYIARNMVEANKQAAREDRPDPYDKARIAATRAEAREARQLARDDEQEEES